MLKILLVGNGGREHAIADALVRENTPIELLCTPGNPGIAEVASISDIPLSDVRAIAAYAAHQEVDLVVVGPEAPLADGLADLLQRDGVPVFGPTMRAASIETSKAETKQMMLDSGIPTARAEVHTDADEARRAVRERFGERVVIKASGLAAGKGVIVCENLADAELAIQQVLVEQTFGSAGAECLVEEFMEGEELSLFALSDGTNVMTFVGAQDHKRLLEGDSGPNTGGMGAYAPVSISTATLIDNVTETILLPVLHAMRKRDMPFRGLLYAGLMLTQEGPKVVEFNCRFGDPETQAVLPLLSSSLLDPMLAIAREGDQARIGNMTPLQWRNAHAVTTVVASPGYPERPITGSSIILPQSNDDLRVYHAGTRRRNGELVTAGGRVVSVTAIASSLNEARAKSAEGAAKVRFEGAQFRRDIAWREAARNA